jgi:diguanylate cyclase (GGDEF)-like protein/PAS domain S-box-containing protein
MDPRSTGPPAGPPSGDSPSRPAADDALVHDLVSAQRYTRSLIEASLDPLVTISSAGKITDVNEATIRATGVPREELVGTDFADYFTDPDRARAGYRRAFHLGTVTDYALVLRHVSGTTIDVHYNASVYRDESGQVLGVFAAARDVTARNRAEASALRLAAIVESSDDAIIAKTLAGTVLSWNPGAERLYGYRAEEIVGRPITILVPPDRREELRDLMRRVAGGEHVAHVETTRVPRQGPPLDISLTVSPLRDASGQVVGVSTITRDITERKRVERELQEASAYNRSLIEASLDPLVTIEPGGTITDVNAATEQVTGCSRQELVGTDFSGYFTDPDFARAGYQAVLREGTVHNYALELRHRDGHTTPVLYNASLYRDDSGRVLGVFAAARDVTAQRDAERQLVHRALHDELTGLPNRALLLDHLSAALARARRSGSVVGLLFLDLDDFKSINDSYGHVVGDEFLVHVGESISGCLRETDVAARIGGDEFVVVCEGLGDPADAELLAERIQRALGTQIPLRDQHVSAPASIGIAISRTDSTPENLLRDADAAMYVAKHRGGRRWEPADLTLHAAALRVLTVEGELRRAIQRDELLVYYQPMVDLHSGRLVAVEALLRWQHPQHGLLLPEAFLDVAEQRNLIGEIGAWVLTTACTQAAEWVTGYGTTAPALAVNVSSRQLGNRGLATLVDSTLASTGLAADHLCLEITESQLIAVAGSATTDLNTLSANGVRIAVDDFGTGYSGFEYLRRLPVNELKIDKSFVDRLGTDATDTAITSSIIALGKSLHLTVVAEGIETPAQRDTVRELGCTWGQGWLWHPARPAVEIEALLCSDAGHPVHPHP